MDSGTQGGWPPPESKSTLVGTPPPKPFQGQSSIAIVKDAELVSMLDTQNVMTVPVGNNNNITNVFNVDRRGGGNTTSNAPHDPDDLTTTTGADHEIYCTQLLTKKRGYPLWVPGPGRRLPNEYRREGISIGDVGIITSLGAFNFLFNLFQPAHHPINRGGVPRGFSPLSFGDLKFDIQEDTVYGPHTFLASSSVQNISMNVIDTSIIKQFESTAREAAILIMPDGATSQDLLNTRGFRDTILRNAEDWYEYARVTRGRSLKNGDIRVVVGIDKVSTWGIATSACSTGRTASYAFKRDPIHAYKWDCSGGSGRVGPQKGDLIEGGAIPENQCVFVRTINFTLSEGVWNDFLADQLVPLASSSMQGSMHRMSSFVNLDLGVNHPSAALHKWLHEKNPDTNVVITEDVDWISVLNENDVVFPAPEDFRARILKVEKRMDHVIEACRHQKLRNRRRDDLRDLSSELSLLRLQETLSTSNRTKRNVKTGGRRQKHPFLPDGLVEEFKHMSPEMQLYIRLKNAEMENISDSEGSTAVTSSATMATERRKRRRRRRKKPYSKQKGSEYTHDGTDEEGECMMEGIR